MCKIMWILFSGVFVGTILIISFSKLGLKYANAHHEIHIDTDDEDDVVTCSDKVCERMMRCGNAFKQPQQLNERLVSEEHSVSQDLLISQENEFTVWSILPPVEYLMAFFEYDMDENLVLIHTFLGRFFITLKANCGFSCPHVWNVRDLLTKIS